ncbi:MAG: hypothetical protein CMP39_02105 [Rickettsiales bacterium]|nr:hypothetical protein [Rickettsiales bacterium]
MAIETLTRQLQQISKYKGIHYSLDHLAYFLDLLGHPERSLKNIVHIAGTNGKGSTLQFLNAICQEHGLSVGTYMSPHITSYTERIQLNNECIPEQEFHDYFDRVYQTTGGQLTEFECLTLMSFCYFSDKQPDVVIYEAGLGGRLDTTNVIMPTLSLITTIGYDHEQYLGDTIEKIAFEKAGIIKDRVPLITTSTNLKSVQNVFKKVCLKKGAPCCLIDPLSGLPSGTRLQGQHQLVNAGIALEAAKQLLTDFDTNKAFDGIRQARHWGRYMKLETKDQLIIIDAAHNEQSMTALLSNLKRDYPDQAFGFLIGLNKTKKTKKLLQLIQTSAKYIYYCEFDDRYAESFENVDDYLASQVTEFLLSNKLPKDAHLVVTGSIYFLGELEKIEAFN